MSDTRRDIALVLEGSVLVMEDEFGDDEERTETAVGEEEVVGWQEVDSVEEGLIFPAAVPVSKPVSDTLL